MQIIPAIDIKGGRCVRLYQGDFSQETVYDADPRAVAQRWVSQGAQRLHLVDLDGAKAGRPVNTDTIVSIVRAVAVPVQLGGGLPFALRSISELNVLFSERLLFVSQS
jgi:phosphoribosylformimino-5-aminoimidazole carboxamide ribotide isomerase